MGLQEDGGVIHQVQPVRSLQPISWSNSSHSHSFSGVWHFEACGYQVQSSRDAQLPSSLTCVQWRSLPYWVQVQQ